MKNILLTFTGFQDPYALGLVGEEEQTGPVLSLVKTKSFDHVILFSTPRTEKNSIATKDVIASEYPTIEIATSKIRVIFISILIFDDDFS